MAKETGSRLADEAYHLLRSAIINGHFAPGTRLKLSDLSARFGFGHSVIREALSRLAEQGLATMTPQRGFSVIPLDIQILRDLTEVRTLVEGEAFVAAIRDGGVEWESGVVAAHYELSKVSLVEEDGELNEVWVEKHRAFHDMLLAGGSNTRLRSLAREQRDVSEIYQRWSRTVAGDGGRQVDVEHRALMEAALARDADEARRLLEQHILRTSETLERFILQ